MSQTIQVNASLLQDALQLLDDREWSVRNAGENTYCPSCDSGERPYRDQEGHNPECAFVLVCDELKRVLRDAEIIP